MGGVGFTEMLLLAVIALIVVGPHRLPKIARTAGRLTRQARNAWQSLQSELQAELDAEHNRKIMDSTRVDRPRDETDSPSDGGAADGTGSASESVQPGDTNESATRD